MAPVRVLVVDDSVVVRRLVANALEQSPHVDVVGTAANGEIALSKVEQLAPDVITMDIEMPVLDGVEAVRRLRAAGHRMPVVMFSTLTERGASATLDALAAGANDYALKPSQSGSIAESQAAVRAELLPKILALSGRTPSGAGLSGAGLAGTEPSGTTLGGAATTVAGESAAPAPVGGGPVPRALPRRPGHPVRAVVVGSSTGGPQALAELLTALPGPLPVPVVVVQHMPPIFTAQLARRLDRLVPSSVVEADDDLPVEPGAVYVAPGGRHLELVGARFAARTRLTDDPPVNFCRPAVDVLFRSAVEVYGGDLLAVVLTGMGQDGKVGCEHVGRAGGTVLVQDGTTSVVWGMPGAVANAGLAHEVAPPGALGRRVAELTRRSAGTGAGR